MEPKKWVQIYVQIQPKRKKKKSLPYISLLTSERIFSFFSFFLLIVVCLGESQMTILNQMDGHYLQLSIRSQNERKLNRYGRKTKSNWFRRKMKIESLLCLNKLTRLTFYRWQNQCAMRRELWVFGCERSTWTKSNAKIVNKLFSVPQVCTNEKYIDIHGKSLHLIDLTFDFWFIWFSRMKPAHLAKCNNSMFDFWPLAKF